MNAIRTPLYAVLACTLCTATFFALPLQAADQDPPTKTVRFDDLNLSSSAGAKALYTRIRLAAQEVCNLSTGGDPGMRSAARACINKAVDDAVLRIHAPNLTTMRFGGEIRLASE
jgi:UrcA family protein